MSERTTLSDIQAIVGAKHTQVAAIFDTPEEAAESMEMVKRESGVSTKQMTLINPMDEHFSDKLEQRSKTIGKTLWRSHLILGACGLALGLTVAFLLVTFGPQLTQNNPLFTYIALISPGIFIGLFVAGLVGLRPDRHKIVETVRSAIRRRKFALVINLTKGQSASAISQVLSGKSNKVVEAAQ